MTIIEQVDILPLLEAYLFANTPMYLYQRFRSNDSLQLLATSNSSEALISEYRCRTQKEGRTAEDIAYAYAILMAFTFFEYRLALDLFSKVDLSVLDWGGEMRGIFLNMHSKGEE